MRSIIVEEIAPAKNQGITQANPQALYSDGSAPSQTGDQYSTYASASGNIIQRVHLMLLRLILAHTRSKLDERMATINDPDTREIEPKILLIGHHFVLAMV